MPLGCRNIEPVCLGAHSIDPDEDESCVSLTVANNTIVGALLQLSSLVRHADDIFCDISEECQLVFERTDKLCKKIANLTITASQLDAKRVQIPEGDLKKFSAVSEHHRARHGYDAHLFLPTNRTQCIHDQYNLCQPNPSHVIRSADLYRKDGLSGSKMFKCWPVTYNDQAVKTPDLSLPRRVQRVRSFERKYKKLRERPKTIHGWDDFKLEDLKNEEEKEKDKYQAKTVTPVVVSIDTSGSNFERMQSLRLSGRRYQNKEEREKKKRRRRTVTGVPESILHEIEKFDRQKRHHGGGARQTPRSYSFDDLDAEGDIERDEGIVKYLDEIDGKKEERLGDEKAQKLMKFFPCRRSRSLPRCMKLASVARSLSVERKSRSTREIDRDLNATYGSSSLSLASAVSSASSRLSRSTKRAIGTKLKSLVSNAKDKPRQRPKSLDIDTFLDSNNKGNSIKSQERSKSTYSLERNKEARSVPDSLLHQEFSEQSSSTVGPGSYYNFESSTLPRAQQKKYDFPWESLPKDWTTSVKLREISKRRSKEDRQSSSGNWSQSGTSSNRHSLDSDIRSEGVKFNSQYSLGKDSGRDSLTLEEENDGATDTTSTAGYAADGTSTIVGSNDSISIGNPKTDFTQLETEQWLQSLAARAAAREEVILADGSASLSRLTRKNIIALDLMLSQDTVQKKGDEESSVYSVDQEGFYTSFHNDSGLRKSTNTLVDEEQCSPTKDSNSVCSVDSVIYRPDHSDDKFANLKKGGYQTKVLSKVTPPLPPVRTTSKNINSDNQGSPVHPELESFSSIDSSVSESDSAVFSRVQDKTVLSCTGFPSLVALSTSDDESSPGSLNSFGLDKKGTRKGDNYIFDETECESRDTQFKLYSKFSPSKQDIGNSLASSKSESNFLQFVNKSSDKLSTLHEQDVTSAQAKAVSYQSWPRTHKSSTPSGILKTPEKQFDNRPHKTLNFAPMVNLFNHGAQNSVQMPLPSPTNSSSSESNVNSFGVFNGNSFSTQPDKKYQLTVPVHGNSNSKLKSKVSSPEILPLKYQPVITVTPRSRSGDRKGTDKNRPARKNQNADRSPIYSSSNVNPKAQSTPHNSSASHRNTSRSQSLYAVSPVVASRDTKRQISNTSSNSEYIDMQSVSGSLQSAGSISSLGSVEGLSFADQSTYMTMSSPCSSPNLSNMDFSMSSTPSGSVNSLVDLRKTPTNELENDTYRINTSLHMNQAYSQRNGSSSNGFEKPSSQQYSSSRRGSANSHQVSSANNSVNNFRSTNSKNTSLNSDNHSMNSSSSSSDNDLTRVTQLSMNSSNGSATGSRASPAGHPNQRQTGRQTRQDTRHEPSYRSHNTSNRRSLPSDVSAVNIYTQKVPLNDTKSQTYTSKTPPSQMSSSKSFPSGFNNTVGSQKLAGSRNRTSPSAPPPPPSNKDGFSSRSDSYRVAMDVCATNNRNVSNRVAMHPSKSYPFLPPTTKSGPYRVAMDMNPKASLNNSYNSDNDDVMSRADSYRIAVRNTNGIVPQDIANRNTSYRVAIDDDAPSMMNLKLDAMSLDSKKKSNSGRDVRRMGITDVDQAKEISVSKPMSNGKMSKSQPQNTSSTRIRKVTKQDVDPIQIVQIQDNNNDTKKSQKNNQNRSSTYIQFDPIFEDDDFGNPADALQIMATKAESGDLSFKDYSASLSSASKVKYGKISGGMRDANSNDIKSAKRGKPTTHVNSGVEIEDNWRFSQV